MLGLASSHAQVEGLVGGMQTVNQRCTSAEQDLATASEDGRGRYEALASAVFNASGLRSAMTTNHLRMPVVFFGGMGRIAAIPSAKTLPYSVLLMVLACTRRRSGAVLRAWPRLKPRWPSSSKH